MNVISIEERELLLLHSCAPVLEATPISGRDNAMTVETVLFLTNTLAALAKQESISVSHRVELEVCA